MAQPSLDLNAESFMVRVTREGTAVRVAVLGELDVAGARRLAAAMDQLLADATAPSLVSFDLRGLLFVDVVGARGLAGATTRTANRGIPVEVSGVGRSIARVLELTGITLADVTVVDARPELGTRPDRPAVEPTG